MALGAVVFYLQCAAARAVLRRAEIKVGATFKSSDEFHVYYRFPGVGNMILFKFGNHHINQLVHSALACMVSQAKIMELARDHHPDDLIAEVAFYCRRHAGAVVGDV